MSESNSPSRESKKFVSIFSLTSSGVCRFTPRHHEILEKNGFESQKKNENKFVLLDFQRFLVPIHLFSCQALVVIEINP